ncbi:MAG: type pilus assembly protein PilB [Patescibacteria group bacterium]|nr:type pilus assembly protein PilB [Patescibacteria group bacterium]
MDVNVRMRINGKLRKIDHFPSEDLRGFVNVVKHSGRLDITQQHIAHDGSFMRALGGHIVDIRVSVIPTIYGEKVVLRFLLQDMSQKSLHDSNLPPRIERQLVNVMRKKSGVILVTGPTGSGKTTMLHRAIRHIAGEDINIQTIEEPVEYRAGEFVNQTAVNEARGFTYPMAIKSVLRQDPDVILVGEIRDKETAQIATEAALTGHLVLSTLHTEDALGSIVRLIQLGVAEWLISSTVVTVINQRLIRKFCDCAEDMPMFPGREYFRGMDIDDHVLDALERDWPKYKIKSPVGCKKCDGEGYRSLQVIVEQLTLTSMVRDMIREGKPYREVIDFIRSKHYMNMIFEEGLRQIMLGNTGFEELRDLPRGDYVMKYPEEIIRDATETAETRRVDIETTSLPQAFIVPREVYDPAPEKSEIGMASIKSPPREALR